MENKKTKQTKSPGQSMVNNLNSIPGNKYNVEEAKFYISRLKEQTGRSEQSILVELVTCGFDNSETFSRYRSALKKEWDSLHPAGS